MSKPIIFATSNAKKLEEVVSTLGPSFPRKVITMDLGLPEFQGEINDICIKKCKEAASRVNGPVIVEDAALCFDALSGLPGSSVKQFLDRIGPLGLYNMLLPYEEKTAQAICTFAYHAGGKNDPVILFQGRTPGVIVYPSGPQDFGWESCFQPDGYNVTFAELPKQEKNRSSQRTKTLKLLKEYFYHLFSE